MLNLTKEEIFDLTRAKRNSTQIRRLREMGFTVISRADGSPVVSRANFLIVTGGVEQNNATKSPIEPDYDAL
ncbi:MAG: DUF4224 domain-containing protein [Gammaproteobacteria bacterium]|nr:DUF4224 domain-containing protein [Gammaproteobacteria bacterium]MDH5799640.1 DUF4224 domain-containing protein [Gammaproteobacteria bacterium]